MLKKLRAWWWRLRYFYKEELRHRTGKHTIPGPIDRYPPGTIFEVPSDADLREVLKELNMRAERGSDGEETPQDIEQSIEQSIEPDIEERGGEDDR